MAKKPKESELHKQPVATPTPNLAYLVQSNETN